MDFFLIMLLIKNFLIAQYKKDKQFLSNTKDGYLSILRLLSNPQKL